MPEAEDYKSDRVPSPSENHNEKLYESLDGDKNIEERVKEEPLHPDLTQYLEQEFNTEEED